MPEGDTKPGATVNKLDRYSEYLFGLADVEARRSWYEKAHPDGYQPTLLFLVRDASPRLLQVRVCERHLEDGAKRHFEKRRFEDRSPEGGAAFHNKRLAGEAIRRQGQGQKRGFA